MNDNLASKSLADLAPAAHPGRDARGRAPKNAYKLGPSATNAEASPQDLICPNIPRPREAQALIYSPLPQKGVDFPYIVGYTISSVAVGLCGRNMQRVSEVFGGRRIVL